MAQAKKADKLVEKGKKRKIIDTPTESFERLRQCFDTIKENHTDPWCWHEYLNQEMDEVPEEHDDLDDDDPEQISLKPKPRNNAERLKTHLLACISELIRASKAADMCYYQIATHPEELKECVIILGTSGDIDEEMLASGDASPQKILALLQEKLDRANAEIDRLKENICELKEEMADTRYERDVQWQRAETSQRLAEEAITRLDAMTRALHAEQDAGANLQAAYDKLRNQHTRGSRLNVYRAREVMRVTFKANKKENMFYAFHGFIYVLTEQKKERIRREMEARRDAVEFSLKNEVRFLLAEIDRRALAVDMLTEKTNQLKEDRRALACRTLHKIRPHERLEYCLWVWELWMAVRCTKALRLEKALEREKSVHAAISQQFAQVSQQLPPMAHRIDVLKRELAEERTSHDLTKRDMMAESSMRVVTLAENLRTHRLEELWVLRRLHDLDCEAKDERIAVLEREIAEDKHIHALKGMVLDLETRLRKALDRRKPRNFVVPPDTGVKCVVCSREVMNRCWKKMPKVPDVGPGQGMLGMTHSISDADITAGGAGKNWQLTQLATSARAKDGPFSAVWR